MFVNLSIIEFIFGISISKEILLSLFLFIFLSNKLFIFSSIISNISLVYSIILFSFIFFEMLL